MISSADLAGATADRAANDVEDLKVTLGWALRRIEALEELLAVIPDEQPELPSHRRHRTYIEMLTAGE